MIKPLPIGSGSNLDIDQTTAHDGVGVAYYNMWVDRAAGIHTFPGLTEHDDTGMGVGSDVYEYFSKTFNTRITVSGGRVWAQYSQSGARVEVTGGSLSIGVPPTFCEDSDNIFVAADSKIFRIDGSAMTVLGGNSPDHVTSLVYYGGFMLANGPEVAGDTTYSDDKETNYELWEVYNNESKPDRLQTLLLVDSQFIYNIGPESLEVTFTGGDPANPFELNRGRLSPFGTIAKYSPVYDGESIYYLSEITQSRKIVKNSGGVPSIISFPVDVPIEQFERVDDAYGFIMAFKGQNFYCLTFPNANATVNEQPYTSITLAYHIQRQTWVILARWDALNGEWSAYRGTSFLFIEPWNLRLVGGRDGKTYRLYDDITVDYDNESVFQHRWRDDNSKEWRNPRTVSLGTAGEYRRPPDQTQCGQYRNRQHEISYSDMTDAGEIFRAAIISGNVNHQADVTKRSNYYRYNVKRGTNEFIINTISEDVDFLRR